MASAYRKRPSELVEITGEPLLAYFFDQAVMVYGQWIESKLSEKKPVKKQGRVVGHKPKWRLAQLLGIDETRVPSADELRVALGL